jgi:hypothetical protein
MNSRSIECVPSGAQAAETLIADGPTISIDIGFDKSWQPGGAQMPDLEGLRVRALIDTGADISFIDGDLATRLRLPIVERARPRVLSAFGFHEADVYLAQIFVRPLLFIQYGEFVGVYLTRHGEPYEVQLGRTFLANFTLIYDGKRGGATLSRSW